MTEKWSFTERCEVWKEVLTGWWQARPGSCTQTYIHKQTQTDTRAQTHRDTLKDQIIMTVQHTTTHQVWTSVFSLLFVLYQFHTVDTAKHIRLSPVEGMKISVWVECEDQYSSHFHIVELTRWIRVCFVATPFSNGKQKAKPLPRVSFFVYMDLDLNLCIDPCLYSNVQETTTEHLSLWEWWQHGINPWGAQQVYMTGINMV